ncbi:HD-GYP domain-containing protein [Comamonas flocculans]|uniref:Phosphodiesterase n=1 Tax=Comamonas flocculans TaxID=2597701 RepID=A0A5B8RSG3_9BURK|nr:phosphodiesterase [Comamonas flocculans]QEA11778.1 phosphodiesterase [Comamonas flocculans]
MSVQAADDDYEDLLAQWQDLEAALSALLLHPRLVLDFTGKVRLCDQWLQDITGHDIDAALYLMFQLASTSTVGYSAAHALVCATLCQILAQELQLPRPERDSLVRAAITMNLSMTALQNELALQGTPLSAPQKLAIAEHPGQSVALLEELDIRDDLWLDVVAAHHSPMQPYDTLADLPAETRLACILSTIDRYAAMISPRKSRTERTASDSVREIVAQGTQHNDEVIAALMRTVGLCPPGTFVRLDNGDTAVVLRRSEQASQPLVASVASADGEALDAPVLYHTARGQPQVAAALARSAVTTDINHHMMVRLGLYAARMTNELPVRESGMPPLV